MTNQNTQEKAVECTETTGEETYESGRDLTKADAGLQEADRLQAWERYYWRSYAAFFPK